MGAPKKKAGPSRAVASTIVKSMDQIAAERQRSRGATMGQASRATNYCHRAMAEKLADWVEGLSEMTRTDALLIAKMFATVTTAAVELDERMKTAAAQPGDGAKVIDATANEDEWDVDLAAFAKPIMGHG